MVCCVFCSVIGRSAFRAWSEQLAVPCASYSRCDGVGERVERVERFSGRQTGVHGMVCLTGWRYLGQSKLP